MGYTKEDVKRHNSGGIGGPYYPAVNVKVYHYPSADQIADHFGCSIEQAEQAGQFAFESAQHRFWNETAQMLADYILAPHFGPVTVYSAGRSAGWLIVEGLTPRYFQHDREAVTTTWDAIDLAKWRKFEREIKAEVAYLTSWDYVRDDIEANRWVEEGARLYNFYEYSDGHSECFVDMIDEGKACPNCAHVLA